MSPVTSLESVSVIFSVVCAIAGFGLLTMMFFVLSRPKQDDSDEQNDMKK